MELLRKIMNYGKADRRQGIHDYNNVFKKTLRDLEHFGFKGLAGKYVLDLGCGQRYPFALMCAAHGAMTTALDIGRINQDPLLVDFFHTIQNEGLKCALRTSARRLLFDTPYYNALEASAGVPLLSHRSSISFVRANPKDPYPLPDGSFDLIASNAVLEHVADLPLFVSEVKRLLKPGGFFYGTIHNFYALSGGHHNEWLWPNLRHSKLVPPWDHLLKNRFPVDYFLNRLLPEDYLDAFGKELNVVLFEGRDVNHDPGGFEGEDLLTPEIYEELKSYPRELLLTRRWCLICRR